MSVIVIIPSGGVGKRFGGDIPKQYQEIGGAPVIIHTLRIFEAIEEISGIIIAAAPEWRGFLFEQKEKFGLTKEIIVAEPGAERQHSVRNALHTPLSQSAGIILIHDAVRPFTSEGLVRQVIQAAREHGAVIPALPLKETVKESDADGFVRKTHERSMLRTVQTPQGFRRQILFHAFEAALKGNFLGTDDASLVEFSGYPVKIIEGEERNIKLTTQFDRTIAGLLLHK